MHAIVDQDSNAQFRPRLTKELVVIPLEDGFAVDGGDHTHIFTGSIAQALHPLLTSVFDGTRTLPELEIALDSVPSEELRTIVSALHCAGILDCAEETVTSPINQETLGYFRRYSSSGGKNYSATDAYRKLQTTAVNLCVPPLSRGADELKAVLDSTGFGRVVLLDPKVPIELSLRGSEALRADSLVVSLCIAGEDVEFNSRLDLVCAKSKMPWLRFVIDDDVSYADLGPLFLTGESPCYQCFRRVHRKESPGFRTSMNELFEFDRQFWISMVAAEIVQIVSGVGHSYKKGDFDRHNLQRSTSVHLSSLRLPGCSTCTPAIPESTEDWNKGLVDTALVFEEYVGLGSRPRQPQKKLKTFLPAHDSHPAEPKRLLNGRSYALPRTPPELPCGAIDSFCAVNNQGESLSLQHLSALLLFSAGIRSVRPDGTVKRWAPTGGNLGSVELYLAVRQARGIDPGFYFYQSQDHALVSTKRNRREMEVEEFMSRLVPGKSAEPPDILILLSASFKRVARKYGPFGYRLVNLDAGAALSQLHLIANALGIFARTEVRWIDALMEDQFNFEPLGEQSTAVLSLSAKPLPPNAPHATDHGIVSVPASAKSPESFCEMTLEQVLEMLFRESRLSKDQLGPLSLGCFVSSSNVSLPSLSTYSLPPAVSGGRPLGTVLTRRKSVRQYSTDPISLQQLSTMLHYAHRGDVVDWPAESKEGRSLRFHISSSYIDGLPPGRYAYIPEAQMLSAMGSAIPFEDLAGLFVQSDFASAPLIIWISGNLATACERHGAFGHRQLLLRAGAAAHRVWLSGLAMGVAGCLVAGVIRGATCHKLGFDGWTESSLIAITLGFELEPEV